MSSTTTASTISALIAIFAIEGYPKTIVSDNGPQLTAETFKEFCLQHGINHLTTAPFHPASNGLAERIVQTFKTSIGKNIKDGYSVKTAVTEYLSSYRLLRGHISARVLTRTWAEGEASDVQAPFAGISYLVFGSWDLGKPLSSPT